MWRPVVCASPSRTMLGMKCLMKRLDEARGHTGEYDETSYELARQVSTWLDDCLSDPRAGEALRDGYPELVAAGEIEIREGVDAVRAFLLGP